jgi:hypothetical protein
MEGNGGGGFELFAVKGGKDANDIVGACRRLNDTSAATQ